MRELKLQKTAFISQLCSNFDMLIETLNESFDYVISLGQKFTKK